MNGKRLTIKKIFILVGIFALGAMVIAPATEKPHFDESQWLLKVSATDPHQVYAHHHKEKHFFNPWLPEKRAWREFLYWFLLPAENEYSQEEQTFLPPVIADTLQRITSLGEKDFILWIGHNTFLIRIGNIWWITDPVFSERVLFKKRKTPPALTAHEIGTLTQNLRIIITHNHYDHFDKKSLIDLEGATEIYVPLGLGKHVGKLNKGRVREMDWWQELDLGQGMKLACLPAQHWSHRLGQGRDSTLWASFLLQTRTATFYFGGDSGYFLGYQEIGKYYPAIDYAFLPVAGCHPRWLMHYNNLNVEESLRAFDELGARYYIPTQWGTFHLSEEPPGYPALELKKKLRELEADSQRYHLMAIGQILPIDPRKSKNF